jgi:uncharacterized protein YbaP (TraB family)
MKNITSVLATLLLLSAVSNQVLAKSSVWKVSKGDDYIYLAGTVHILPPSEFPLPLEFDKAYKDADEIVLEVKLPADDDTTFQIKMMQALTYAGDTKLSDFISEQTYAQLESYAISIGADMLMFEKFKPGLLLTMFTMMEAQRAGLSGEGVDAYFNKRALQDGKMLNHLETMDFQINMLANMGKGYEDSFLKQNMEEFKVFKTLLLQLIAAWRIGDLEALNKLALEPMTKDPQSMKAILLDRNHNWIPLIEAMFTDHNKELVMVGAAHLVGQEGVISLLEHKGYTVTQLSAK